MITETLDLYNMSRYLKKEYCNLVYFSLRWTRPLQFNIYVKESLPTSTKSFGC